MVAWAGQRRTMKTFQPLRLRAANTKDRSDIVGDVRAAFLNGFESDQHPANEHRHVGHCCPKFDKGDAKLPLFGRQTGKTCCNRSDHKRINIQMCGAHRHIHVADG